MASQTDTLTRWFATLASTLVAAAIIGMAVAVVQMEIKIAQLETKLQALQSMHAAHEVRDDEEHRQ